MIQENILLKNHSHYKIGGPASFFGVVHNTADIQSCISKYKEKSKDTNIFILGQGTNVLIDDAGYDGLVIQNKIQGIELIDNVVKVGSGTLMSEVVDFFTSNGLSGLEWAGGLPGTVGGAVRGNAGAFGGETKDNVFAVESINLENLASVKRNNTECLFSYRSSIFKIGTGSNDFISNIYFAFTKGEKDKIMSLTKEKVLYRKERHPIEYPNIGSIFKNINLENVPADVLSKYKDSVKDDPFPILPVAKLLADAGVKGKTIGGAMISEKHPNFIINSDNASSEDVKRLIEYAKEVMVEKYGIVVEEEIMYLNTTFS